MEKIICTVNSLLKETRMTIMMKTACPFWSTLERGMMIIVRIREDISASVVVRSSALSVPTELICSEVLLAFWKCAFSLFREYTRTSSATRRYICLQFIMWHASQEPFWVVARLTVGFYTTYACQDSSLVLHCSQNSVINIQSAFYGRRSDKICPYGDGSSGKSQC